MEARILIVDDDPFVRLLFLPLFEDRRYIVDAVHTGDDALKRLGEQRYDLVCTDLVHPGVDGLTLIQEIKQRWPEVQVIMITRAAFSRIEAEAKLRGAAAFLGKAARTEEIVKAVETVLRKRGLADPNTPALSREQLLALARAHVRAEAERDVEATLATLEEEPFYELHPVGRRLIGRAAVRRYYEWLLKEFITRSVHSELRAEYVGDEGVVHEYTMWAKNAAGGVERFGVVAVFTAGKRALAGERVYADEGLLRWMMGPVFDEAGPILPLG